MSNILKQIKQHDSCKRKEKTYKGEFWTINSLFGNDWARWFILLGGREAGKSYAAMKWGVNRKLHLGDKFKFYWFRLTEKQQQKLLLGGGQDFIDPDIREKYGVKTFSKGNRIYTYKEKESVSETGKVTTTKTEIKEFATIMACSTFYNDKGVGYFDANYDGEYYVILDEMNRESCEANRFDIVYAFCNQIENVLRSTHVKVKVVCIGNTLDEASDILSAFNFIPDNFGRYKIKNDKFKAVIDYIKPNEQYKERRKHALANALAGDSSTFTNEVVIDRSLLVNKRIKRRPTAIIKFNKESNTWFTLWDNNIICAYNKEKCKVEIAMRKYLDCFYDQELANSVFERFNVRYFRYTEVSTFKRFQKNLRLLKK